MYGLFVRHRSQDSNLRSHMVMMAIMDEETTQRCSEVVSCFRVMCLSVMGKMPANVITDQGETIREC